jgi:transposase
MECADCFTVGGSLQAAPPRRRSTMTSKIREDSVAASVIGIDIGKEVFHLVGFSADGRLVLRQKIKRLALEATFKKLPSCIVGMEACLSAHFVSRTLRGMGFEPRIIPAIYVKPFNKGQKNDYNDAEAIAEAAMRPKAPEAPHAICSDAI